MDRSNEIDFDNFRNEILTTVSAAFRGLAEEGRATISIAGPEATPEEPDAVGAPPEFAVDVKPLNPASAAIGVFLWPEFDMNVEIGSHGARIEWHLEGIGSSSLRQVKSDLVDVCEMVIFGRLTERVELDRKGQTRAVFTNGWDQDGETVVDIAHVVGGRKGSHMTVAYEAY